MKLKKLLKYFDGVDDIVIWNKNNETNVADYKGPIFDVPKKFKKYKLVKDWRDGSLALYYEVNEHNAKIPYLVAVVEK